MSSIIVKTHNSITIDTGQNIEYNMANWPVGGNEIPMEKSQCYWNGSSVVLKTNTQVIGEYKEKKFKETNDYVISKLCYVKKIKKFEDITTLFDTKKNQTYITKEQVDTACNEIITDLF